MTCLSIEQDILKLKSVCTRYLILLDHVAVFGLNVGLCPVLNYSLLILSDIWSYSTRIMLVGARRKHLPFCLRLISVSYLSPSTSIVIQVCGQSYYSNIC